MPTDVSGINLSREIVGAYNNSERQCIIVVNGHFPYATG